MKFNPGDLVLIVGGDASIQSEIGKVGSVIAHCTLPVYLAQRLPYYYLTCADPHIVVREDALKLIGGDYATHRAKKTEREPVEA